MTSSQADLEIDHDAYYGYAPLRHWQKVVSFYGDAAARSNGDSAAVGMFEIVKQLSTSCFAVDIHPHAGRRGLYLGFGPPALWRRSRVRIRVALQHPGVVSIRLLGPGTRNSKPLSRSRATAFPALNVLMGELHARGGGPRASSPLQRFRSRFAGKDRGSPSPVN